MDPTPFPVQPVPTRRYASFLVRCWRMSEGAHRVQVEQVQSGARTQVATLAEALAWMEACCGEAWADGPAASTATD